MHDVAEQLDGHTAHTNHDDRPEGGVVNHADDDLMAFRRHFLYQHAVDNGTRLVASNVGQHGIVGSGDRGAIGQPKTHAPGLGFVRQVGRLDFQYHREAQHAGRVGGGFGGPDQFLPCLRQPRRQHLLREMLRDHFRQAGITRPCDGRKWFR